MSHARGVVDGQRWGPTPGLGLAVIGLVSLLGGLAVGVAGLPGAAMAMALPLAAAIFAAPQLGAYLWLGLSPLIVGIERGDVLPFVRPNEALLLLILGAAALRVLPAMAAGRWPLPRLQRVDLALLLLLVTGSILPVLLRYGRSLPMETYDLLYGLVLVKYLLIFALFRCTIRTVAQVRACIVVAMASAVPVSIVALLQVNGLLGVPEFLATYYDQAFSGTVGPVTARGTSTVASTFGVANIMIMVSCILLAWFVRQGRPRLPLLLVAVVCLLGIVAAGQFSGFFGIVIAVAVTGFLLGRLKQVVIYAVPVLLLGAALLWPVVEERLAGFERESGLPQSWDGRIDNLERFILPELTDRDNWLLGVRPAPQIPAPERWRQFVYIESGYLWLLWIGGLPFLAAFLAFAWVGIRDAARIARQRNDAIGLAAVAATATLVMITVLMLFDPHLTMRGGADLFFPLLALALVEPAGTGPRGRSP